MASTESSVPRKTLGKVRPHQTQNEGLVFEKSAPGKRAYKLPPLDVPAVDAKSLLRETHRADAAELPELSEIEIIRHFTRLSTWNYAIDLGMYPLGSCTMKYNPRVNEFVARIEGLAEAHPYRPESLAQGVLDLLAQGIEHRRHLLAVQARCFRRRGENLALAGRLACCCCRHAYAPCKNHWDQQCGIFYGVKRQFASNWPQFPRKISVFSRNQ